MREIKKIPVISHGDGTHCRPGNRSGEEFRINLILQRLEHLVDHSLNFIQTENGLRQRIGGNRMENVAAAAVQSALSADAGLRRGSFPKTDKGHRPLKSRGDKPNP